jgi:uncharacterized protein YdbL (DUF1318 family)
VRLLAPALIFGIALFAGAAAVTAAQGPSADQLRAAGRACEQPDGFLRALAPDAEGEVQQINAQIRRQPAYRAC